MAIALNSRLNVEYFEPISAEKNARIDRVYAAGRDQGGAAFWRGASARHRAMLRDVSSTLDDAEVAFANAWQLSCETGVSPSDLMRYATEIPAQKPRFSAMSLTAVALAFVVVTPFIL